MPKADATVEALPSPVFDAHTHLDAMAARAGVTASAGFVADVMTQALAVGVRAAITVGDTVEEESGHPKLVTNYNLLTHSF